MNILLVALNAKYIHSNLAVYSLRAYAAEFRDQIAIAEFTINQRADFILREIYKTAPDVLCLSCYIWNISLAMEVAEEYHKISPGVPIWAGGPEVSYETEDFLRRRPYITGVMIGEGERTFRMLCRHFILGGSLDEIPGIAYRRDGKIMTRPCANPLPMDELPFAYGGMENFQNKIIYYESSRGCPFCCSYCLSSVERNLRFRDLKLVKRELEFFIEHNIPQVKFVDRTFNCDCERAVEIWKFIRERDRGITNFHFEVAADLMTEKALELIGTLRPGLIQLEIGVQTTNPAALGEIHRRTDLKALKRVVKRIGAGENVHQHLDLIAGLPFEDYASFQRSFDEVYSLKPDQLQLGFLKVLKGSALYEHRGEYGLVCTTRPPYEVLANHWLSYGELLRIKRVEEMLEVYYNSGQYATSIRLLEQYFNSAFEMFLQIGDYYDRRGYFAVSHTRNRRAEILLEFAKEALPSAGVETMERLREAAVFDIYVRENAKSRPRFAQNMREWKLPARTYCRKGALSHLERFWYEADGRKRETPYYLLFDYEKRDPLHHRAGVERIDIP